MSERNRRRYRVENRTPVRRRIVYDTGEQEEVLPGEVRIVEVDEGREMVGRGEYERAISSKQELPEKMLLYDEEIFKVEAIEEGETQKPKETGQLKKKVKRVTK